MTDFAQSRYWRASLAGQQQIAKNKKIAEARLLKSLNENCVLAENDLLRFRMLSEKRQQQELPPEELEELFLLIEQEERLRLQRINILGELAQIKGISLLQLTNDLGLNYLESD